MKVKDVFDKFLFSINSTNNGEISIFNFNIISESSELRLMQWLTGGLSGINVPAQFVSQKNRDLLSPFLAKSQQQVTDGLFKKPPDYYTKDSFFRIGDPQRDKISCSGENEISGANTTIDVLDGEEYQSRLKSYIPELRNSLFSKLFSKDFVLSQKSAGTCVLEYIRYPRYAKAVSVIDNVHNVEVIDTVNSIDYEWSDAAKEVLVWFMVDQFTDWNSNSSQKKNNYDKANNILS